MTNTDSPLDDLIADINADWWNDGQTSYEDGKAEQERTKQAIELYCHKQVIEELESLINNQNEWRGGHGYRAITLEVLKDRIAKLRKTL